MQKHGTLVLIRHGESRMNVLDRFTGWIDCPLSVKGVKEAQRAGKECKKFDYDAAFTSNLSRAQQTLLIVLSDQHKMGIFEHAGDERYNSLDQQPAWFLHETLPIFVTEALNERAYGELQGDAKEDAVKKYGDEQVLKWRRGFKDRPPGGESLEDVYNRVVPFFESTIVPRMKQAEEVIISGHGNTLRAVIKHLEQIADDKIPFVNLPHAEPIVYSYKKDFWIREEGEFGFDRPLR